MLIEKNKFQKKFYEAFLSDNSVCPSAFWKWQVLINESETYYLTEYDCYYAVYNKFLFLYISPDRKCHIPIDELNALDCIYLNTDIVDSIKDKLIGFEPPSYSWHLHYDREYKPPVLNDDFCVVDFDFSDYEMMTYTQDSSGWFTVDNVKKV